MFNYKNKTTNTMKHSIKISLMPSKTDVSSIRIRVSFSGERVDLIPGLSYNISKWDANMQRAKNNTRNDSRQSASEINKTLNNMVNFIDDYFSKCDLNAVTPYANDLKEEFNARFKSKKESNSDINILSLYDDFMREMEVEKSWAYNTVKKYLTMRNMIKEMNIKDVSSESLQKIVSSEISDGKRNVTVAKNLRLIKVFGKWLKSKGKIEYEVDDFKPRLKGSGNHHKALIYLDYEELTSLLNYDFSKRPSLGVARDVFCFCAFSGLRYSDVKKLQKSDIRNECINIVTQKTSDSLKIELNKYTTAILEKYKALTGKYALPVISNQNINKELKEACRIVGIDSETSIVTFSGANRIEIVKPKYEFMTFHAARRTFVVECLRRGISAEVIMKWTGHSNFEAMKPYMDIVDSLKKMSMKKFDD